MLREIGVSKHSFASAFRAAIGRGLDIARAVVVGHGRISALPNNVIEELTGICASQPAKNLFSIALADEQRTHHNLHIRSPS